eukprot:TRINITY_DN5_c0_g1_i4.p2 TRINITY_DN5_c0_g1~~TRINITY_DN5_c0_g1_i4.p2  ORF type:complete len:247 (-),score=-19.42 TRINITY_DN5_c0_g1_i4:172-912(-)
MARSPGFGSIPCNQTRSQHSLSLRLPYAVNLATKYKSLTHYTKGTPSRRSAPTACMHTVSGSISLPSQGFFSPFPHGTGSLSVSQEYLALEDGPPIFSQDNTCPDLLVFTTSSCSCTGLSPGIAQLSNWFHSLIRCLRANPRSLAATRGISVDFFSYRYLDVSVPYVCLYNLCIQLQIIPKDWVSPFGHLWLKCVLSAHHSFSQTYTSFIASNCQGIHRIRFVTQPYNPKSPLARNPATAGSLAQI